MTHHEAAQRRSFEQQNRAIFLAWHTVALDRQKRLPPFKKLLVGPERKEKKPQTWQEQAAIARQLNAAFGGRVTQREQPHA